MKILIRYLATILLKINSNIIFVIYGKNYKKKKIIESLKKDNLTFVGVEFIDINNILFEKKFSNEENFFHNYQIDESPHLDLIKNFFQDNTLQKNKIQESLYFKLFYQRNKILINKNKFNYDKYISKKYKNFKKLFQKIKKYDYNKENRFIYLIRIKKYNNNFYKVLSGHHRISILKFLKYSKIKVVVFK